MERSLREAQARLQRPWSAVFASVEGIGVAGIAWLSLEVSENGNLRLEGSAPDTAAALLVAQRLRRDPLWREVTLGRIANGTRPGEVRMEISAVASEGIK